MTKLLVAVAAVLLAVHGYALAPSASILVIAVDLTQSVAVVGPDGKAEFQKNIDAVTKQLAQVPSDSRVTVIGITDRSFTQPDILVSATIPADPGYFGERLKAARSQLVSAWKTRSAKLSPHYPQTDILGALLLTKQIFDQHGNAARRTLIIYSDMRQSTRELNLEDVKRPPTLAQVAGTIQIADLRAVHVQILGVDGAGTLTAFWQELQEFWLEYFRTSGACTESYTALR